MSTAADFIRLSTSRAASTTVTFILLILCVLFAGVDAASADDRLNDGPVDVTPTEAVQLLNENPDIVVLDVRTPVEFYISHIENAINVNYYSFSFKSKLKQLDRSKTYLLHCQTGVRSGKTIPLMIEAGFSRVYHLNHGFKAWKQANLPTT